MIIPMGLCTASDDYINSWRSLIQQTVVLLINVLTGACIDIKRCIAYTLLLVSQDFCLRSPSLLRLGSF